MWHINSYLFYTGLATKLDREQKKGRYVLDLSICFVVERKFSNIKQRQILCIFEIYVEKEQENYDHMIKLREI